MDTVLYLSFVELDIPNACQTHSLGVLRGLSNNLCTVEAVLPRPCIIRPYINNVNFHYVWPWRFSTIGKLWFKVISFFLIFIMCIRKDFTFLYVREMEMNPGPFLISKLFKIPLYIEINELIVPFLKENGLSSIYINLVKWFQKFDYQQSVGLIIPSVPMRDWIIKEYGLPPNKTHLIINGTQPKSSKNIFSSKEAKKNLKLNEDSFCLGFVGNVYPRYDFKTILIAIRKCKETIKKVYFIIVGNGPILETIVADAKKLGVNENIILTGYVQSEKLGKIIPAFDIGTLLLTKKAVQRYGPVTSKLALYGMHNLPVISAGNNIEGYPEEIKKGIYLVDPENPEKLSQIIIESYKNKKNRYKKADILNKYVREKLNWNAIVKKILDINRSKQQEALVENYNAMR